MHTAGIYADMTVDGPEIGTLVVVVDRAKNLPNRKTMGKQNPYCAARLGKEAKKTDTDQRGGQTPRWDQELRFTVHDSPDYNNLKLSIFNDDKKTDLISEAWISLLDVLQPGGGQNDQWHHLTFKGKYAGEIRMELTYYDTRPRTEGRRVSDMQDSSVRSRQQSGSGMSGPRQPSSIKRRPLPSDPPSGVPVPSPRMGPRDYSSEIHGPSTVGGSRPLPPISVPERSTYQQDLPELDHDEPNYGNEVYHDADQGVDDYDIPISDDPYALQALEDQHNWEDGIDAPEVTVPRNARVEALSNYSISRALPAPLNHTQSAPVLGPYEQVPQAQHGYPEGYSQYDDYENQYSPEHDLEPPQGYYNHSSAISSPRSPAHQQYDQAGPPPPPPTHRNSAPNLPRMAPMPTSIQYSSTPTRALHMSTSNTNMSGVRKITPQRHSYADPNSYQQQSYNNSPAYSQQEYSQHHTPISPPYPDQQAYDRGYSQESAYRPHQPPFDPRRSSDYRQSPSAPRPRPPPQHQNSRPYDSSQPYSPRPPQYAPSPQYRSQPHSPMPPNTPQYNSPRLPPSQTHSPAFPPPRSNPHTPSHARNASLPVARKSISPMPSPHTQSQIHSPQPGSVPFSPDSYSNPHTPQAQPQTHKTLHIGLEPDANPLSPDAHAGPPIIGLDGRVKDPSDHLPVSSYAPEPDSKKGRPSIQVNVRNRFGPRELGSGGGSPLGVGSANVIGGGPPPVPGKVPLSFAGGSSVSGLEQGIRGMSVDGGGAGAAAAKGGVFGRMRRLGG